MYIKKFAKWEYAYLKNMKLGFKKYKNYLDQYKTHIYIYKYIYIYIYIFIFFFINK